MSKKIITFGASSSKKSINNKLAVYTAQLISEVEIIRLDLNDFEMPIYSVDRENESGIHPKAYQFKEYIKGADGIIISFAEHNGSYSSAYKNILDWVSRIDSSIWIQKPMFLLSTSPGPRGAKGVLSTATGAIPFQGGQVIADFSLPSFYQNFSDERGIIHEELKYNFKNGLSSFVKVLTK